jgi:hypothetical protein
MGDIRLVSICEFGKNRPREGRNILTDFSEITVVLVGKLTEFCMSRTP